MKGEEGCYRPINNRAFIMKSFICIINDTHCMFGLIEDLINQIFSRIPLGTLTLIKSNYEDNFQSIYFIY